MNVIQGCTCCGEGCESIAEDSFDRSNSSNINTSAPFTWSGDTSQFEIAGNRLLCSGTNTGSIQCGTANPASSGSGVVFCTFELFDPGETIEVWLNGTDEDNCTVARLTIGSPSTLQIYERISGVDTLNTHTTLSVSGLGSYTLGLRYSSSSQHAQAYLIDGATTTELCSCEAVLEVGYYAGLSVGAHDFTDIYANDFTYTPLGGECQDVTCDPCDIVVDRFTRSSGTDISSNAPCAGWTEASGGWSISSNSLSCTSSGLAIHRTDCPSNVVIEVDFLRTSNADARIIFGYLNTSNYYFAEYDNLTITINKRIGGVSTLLAQAAAPSGSGTAKVCVNDTTGFVTAYLNGTAAISTGGYAPPGTQAGVGATLGSGAVAFDNFIISRSASEDDSECEECDSHLEGCAECPVDTDNTGLRFVVDFGAGGLTNDDCSRCADVAGEHTLSLVTSCLFSGFVAANSATDCGGLYWIIRLEIAKHDGKCYLRVTVYLSTETSGGSSPPDPSYAQYEIADTEPSLDQADSPWTLTKSPGHTSTYRSLTDWKNPGEDWSNYCFGSLPSTISVRAEYV